VPFRESELKTLPKATSTKEDLQVIYEAIQELGYTEYSVLKLLDRLREYLEELKRLTRDSEKEEFADMRDVRERTKELQADLDQAANELKERIREVSDQVDTVLTELQESLKQGGHSDALAQIARHWHILIQASRQVLVQNGYDPETGNKIPQIDQDWNKTKKKVHEFLWALATSLLISGIFYLHTVFQETKQNRLNQQIVEVLKERKENPGKPGVSPVQDQNQTKSK
jgi:hypothetical protein